MRRREQPACRGSIPKRRGSSARRVHARGRVVHATGPARRASRLDRARTVADVYGRPMARFAVVGSGAWGTALAAHLARLEHEVIMWAFEPEVAAEIAERHTNTPFLPGIALPPTIRASNDAAAVVA